MWVFLATVAAAVAVFSGSVGVAESKCVVAFDGEPGTDTDSLTDKFIISSSDFFSRSSRTDGTLKIC